MIILKDFSIGYGKNLLIEGVNTEFKNGTLISLLGRNGTGKSTLLKAIAGLNPDYTGEILIHGKNLRGISKSVLAKEIAFVTTRRPRISNLSCRDIVSLGRSPYTDWVGRLTEKDRHMVDEALYAVDMQSFAERSIDSLSDGEAQRIMIARAIAQATPVIILDEPTSFLDLPTRFEVVELLRNLSKEEGKCILFSTHELDIALEISDEIALIDKRSLYHLPVDEMIEKQYLQHLFKTSGNFIERMINLLKESRK